MTIKKKALSGVVALVATAGVAVAVNMASTAEAARLSRSRGGLRRHKRARPGIVKKPDGTYLIAHTGDNIVLKTSTDRTAFKEAGAAFPNGASWTTAYTGGAKNLWAPDISYHDGKYWLYYSASTFGSNKSAIFLATSTTGASGSLDQQRLVIASSSSNNYNAIDPNLERRLLRQLVAELRLVLGRHPADQDQLRPPACARTPPSARSPAGAAARSRRRSCSSTARTTTCTCRSTSAARARPAPTGSWWVARPARTGRSSTRTARPDGRRRHRDPGRRTAASTAPADSPCITDSDADVLVYHYYNASGTAKLGINLLELLV